MANGDSPEYQNAYNRLIIEARREYLTELRPEMVQQLYNEYAHTIDNIVQVVGTGRMTASRGEEMAASIMDELQDLADQLDQQVTGFTQEAANMAARGHASALTEASSIAGVEISHNFGAVPDRAIRLMMARRDLGMSTTFKTLINRHIEQMAPEVDRAISTAVQRGMNAPDFAEDLAKIMARSDPAVKSALQNVSIDPSTRRIVPSIGADPDVLSTQEYQKAKRLLFDNYRIAVTETNTAHFEADRVASTESPVVTLVRWRVSGRHFGLPSSPDVCTLYLNQNLHGYGVGLYHPASVPALPHPFCGCWTEKQLQRPSDWGEPTPEMPDEIRKSSTTEAEKIFERAREQVKERGGNPRTITENHLNRQVDLANSYLETAHELARQTQ